MTITVVNNGIANTLSNTKQMDGEKIPGDLHNWDYLGTDPNELLAYSYDTLSQRATTLYHTHGPIASAINKQTHYAIGQGLVFRSQPDWQILGMDKKAAKDWSIRFQKLIHYTLKLLNFYEKQSILFRTSLIMGDSLLMFDRSDPPFKMPFDLVEAGGDQIDYDKTGTTLGIYTDNLLRRKGVALVDSTDKIEFQDENGDQNIIQFYLKLMARQLRGYPLPYRIIAAAKNNDRWWDATLARAVLESIILGNTTGSPNADEAQRQAEFLANAQKGENNAQDTALTNIANSKDLGVGNILSLSGGGTVDFTVLQTPGNNFDKLQSAYLDIVGMATDTPPEVVAGKYSTSYTAHKGAFNDFIKSYMAKRNSFIKSVCHVVVREVAKYLFMEGLIEMPAPGFFDNPIIQEATIAGNYLGPVPGHINPLQEVNAKVIAKDNAFMLPGDAAAEYGNEWDNMIEEWGNQMSEWADKSPAQQAAAVQDDLDNMDDDDLDPNDTDDDLDKQDDQGVDE